MLPTTYFKVLILRTGVYLYTYTNKCTYVYILNIQTNYIWEHNFKRNFLGDSSIRSRLLSVAHWVSDEPMLCQSAITQHRAKWADLQHLRGSLHVPLLTPVSYNHYMYPLAITKLQVSLSYLLLNLLSFRMSIKSSVTSLFQNYMPHNVS